MADSIKGLVKLVQKIQAPLDLAELVGIVTEESAHILGIDRVSIRLIDQTGEFLEVAARFGDAVHQNSSASFRVGEGLIGWVAERNESVYMNDALRDSRYVPKPGMTMSIGSYLGVPLRVGAQCIGVISATSEQTRAFDAQTLDVLTLIAAIASPYLEIARLAALTHKDPLTGVLNRRGLAEIVARPNFKEIVVGMLDVDHFKTVNDTYGHHAGDEVLKTVAQTMWHTLRASDCVVRYGGEEFLFVMFDLSIDVARDVAERLRANIAAKKIGTREIKNQVTVSIGIAKGVAHEPFLDVVERADQAMYQAKQNGRNKVVVDNHDDVERE